MTPNIAPATAFLKAMKDKDLSQAPLAQSLSYHGPLSGEDIRGRDHVTRFLKAFLPALNDVRTVRHIADGDYVATVWQADTSFGQISFVYVFRIEMGQYRGDPGLLRPAGFP
jgi:hypothetical protein